MTQQRVSGDVRSLKDSSVLRRHSSVLRPAFCVMRPRPAERGTKRATSCYGHSCRAVVLLRADFPCSKRDARNCRKGTGPDLDAVNATPADISTIDNYAATWLSFGEKTPERPHLREPQRPVHAGCFTRTTEPSSRQKTGSQPSQMQKASLPRRAAPRALCASEWQRGNTPVLSNSRPRLF